MAPHQPASPVDLDTLPGHQIRRLQQIAVAVFLQETQAQGLTPVQFAALHTVCGQPGIDQRTLAGRIGFDTSTITGVLDRLEARGLLRRSAAAHDRRVRQLQATPEGQALVRAAMPGVQQAQARILAPLPAAEQAEFMRLLALLVAGNNELSRAPEA